MEPHKILNTSTLTVISGHELDNHGSKGVPEEVNLLREKTFTRELSSLVSRIFSNESAGISPDEKDELINLTEKNRVLLEYEKLIYSLKQSMDLPEISSKYNPFHLNVDVHDDIDDIDDYLKAGMDQSGFNEYGIFKFNLKENAFRFDSGSFAEPLSKNCFFGVNDPVFSGTFPKHGIILKSENIDDDPFLAKKFKSSSDNISENNSFYINRIYNYCKNLFSTTGDPELTRLEKYTSPLLVISLPGSRGIDESDIHKIIEKNLCLPLSVYLAKNRLTPVMTNFDYEESLLLIELFQKMSYNSTLKWCLIKGEDFSSLENFFMLKYLLSKLRLQAGHNSLIMRIASNKIVMALEEREIPDIQNSVSDFINRSSEILNFSFIDYFDLKSKNKLIELFI